MRLLRSSGQPKKARRFIVRRIEGHSMLPSLTPGQVVFARTTQRIRVGDVVIVQHGGMEKIKRVAQQQGDALYLLGDNASASTDSRSFGWLPAKTVLGKVVWPRV